jgi:hypothetical protein
LKGWDCHGFKNNWAAVRTGMIKGNSGRRVSFSTIDDLEASLQGPHMS